LHDDDGSNDELDDLEYEDADMSDSAEILDGDVDKLQSTLQTLNNEQPKKKRQ